MAEGHNEVGTGMNLFAAGEVTGVARWFNDTSDVLDIDDEDLEDLKTVRDAVDYVLAKLKGA